MGGQIIRNNFQKRKYFIVIFTKHLVFVKHEINKVENTCWQKGKARGLGGMSFTP